MFNRPWTTQRKQNIKKINFSLGTKYRTVPFDMKNPEDLQEIIEQASGYYLDSLKFRWQLDELLELVDESLETFFPDRWIEISLEEALGDTPLQALYFSLRETNRNALEVREDAEKACKEAWEIFLSCAPQDTIKEMTTATSIKNIDWDDVVSKLIDLDNLPYSIGESAKKIGKILGDLAKEKR